jgi:hypothetical protein
LTVGFAKRRAFVYLVLAAAVLVTGAQAAPGKPKAPKRVQSANLLANGSFEGSLSGWYGGNARVSLTTGGTAGSSAALVSLSAPGQSSFWLSRSARPVSATVKGVKYSATAWFRSDVEGRRVCLRVREWGAGDTAVGSATSCVTTARSWQQTGTVAYTAIGAGNEIDVYAFQTGASAGDAFQVDDVQLVTTASGGPSASPTPPSPAPAPAPALAPTPSSSLTATAVDNAHVRLGWPAVAGAARYQVSRGSLVVGSTSGTTFTDNLLWPATRYEYTVTALNASGQSLRASVAFSTTQQLPAAGFQRIYSPSSVWNQPLAANPALDPGSAAKIAYFAAEARNPNLTLRAYANPVAEAHPSDQLFNVPCTRYSCTLAAFGSFPIPVTAVADSASDAHLTVHDPATNREWDMWQARNLGGSWSASAGAAVSTLGNGIAPAGTAGSNAANFPMLGGIVRPEEIAQGHIDHALYFTMPNTGQGAPVCPATHNGGSTTNPNALRQGARLQLDPAVDVEALPIPGHAKVIARALQKYGMFLRDQGGSFAIYGENPSSRGYDAWANVGLGGLNSTTLRGLPLDRFRVIAAANHPNC